MPRVVVIDDEQFVAEACAIALRATGCEVSIAHDGESGLRLIQELLPDVVVCDIRMPGISGLEVASLLKAQPATNAIPILLISGHGHPDRKSCDAFLPKPFVVAELISLVKKLATHSNARA